jgi:agmatine/peptidylarginine deiminase
MFLKIVSEDTVVIGQYRPGQPDYQVLEDCAALFERSSNGAGKPWRVVRVPQPDVYYAYFVLPVVRTFTNGLIVNDRVIVPVYGIPEDAEALEIFARELPGRQVIGLNANDIIESAGAWHCVTMEYPRP